MHHIEFGIRDSAERRSARARHRPAGFVFEHPDLGELVLIGDLEDRRAEIEQRFQLPPNPRASTRAAETSMAG